MQEKVKDLISRELSLAHDLKLLIFEIIFLGISLLTLVSI